MSFMGTSMSLVNTESGAVSCGVFDLSSLLFFFGLVLPMGDIDILDLLVLNGESVLVVVRPLLVRTPSLGLGVGGLCT
jgi:hypothetical protein